MGPAPLQHLPLRVWPSMLRSCLTLFPLTSFQDNLNNLPVTWVVRQHSKEPGDSQKLASRDKAQIIGRAGNAGVEGLGGAAGTHLCMGRKLKGGEPVWSQHQVCWEQASNTCAVRNLDFILLPWLDPRLCCPQVRSWAPGETWQCGP